MAGTQEKVSRPGYVAFVIGVSSLSCVSLRQFPLSPTSGGIFMWAGGGGGKRKDRGGDKKKRWCRKGGEK